MLAAKNRRVPDLLLGFGADEKDNVTRENDCEQRDANGIVRRKRNTVTTTFIPRREFSQIYGTLMIHGTVWYGIVLEVSYVFSMLCFIAYNMVQYHTIKDVRALDLVGEVQCIV